MTSVSVAAPYTVNALNTTTTLSVDINPQLFGQDVTFTGEDAAVRGAEDRPLLITQTLTCTPTPAPTSTTTPTLQLTPGPNSTHAPSLCHLRLMARLDLFCRLRGLL